MTKRTIRGISGGALLMAGGVALASNMGFKLSPDMSSPGRTYTLSLPLDNNYPRGPHILIDMDASGCHSQRITKVEPSADAKGTQSWVPAGGIPGGNFHAQIGEAYIVAISNAFDWLPSHY